MWLKLLGRVGWGAKAVIYALIGGLACDNAVGNENSSASPQVSDGSQIAPPAYTLMNDHHQTIAKQG